MRSKEPSVLDCFRAGCLPRVADTLCKTVSAKKIALPRIQKDVFRWTHNTFKNPLDGRVVLPSFSFRISTWSVTSANQTCLGPVSWQSISPHSHVGLRSSNYCHFSPHICLFPSKQHIRVYKNFLRGNSNSVCFCAWWQVFHCKSVRKPGFSPGR